MGKRINYRKIAFDAYGPLCAHCGFGIPAVLEVAHIDCNRENNDPKNLIVLCPNCHTMHDLGLISTETIIQMRDRPKIVKWSKRMKAQAKPSRPLKKQPCLSDRADGPGRSSNRRTPQSSFRALSALERTSDVPSLRTSCSACEPTARAKEWKLRHPSYTSFLYRKDSTV